MKGLAERPAPGAVSHQARPVALPRKALSDVHVLCPTRLCGCARMSVTVRNKMMYSNVLREAFCADGNGGVLTMA